ncbi:MAG: fibronectin type III domain-containing protein [Solirubrobacterales bacterium]
MSEENVEMVRSIYEPLNRGDWEAVFRDAHPEFEITTQRGPTAGTKGESFPRYRIWAVLLIGLALLTASLTPQAALGAYTSSLNNGVIKVGIDATEMGGAITYLSEATSPTNLINIYDRGRAVQQSYYAGADVNRSAEGQHPFYSPWPWNPITAGDVYGDRATVIASQNTSTTMYVKTRPLLWDMPLEQCECVFETWVTLEDRRVRVHNKLTTTRTDNRWNVLSRDQELPAVYPIANLPQVVSYTGSQPFTGEPTSDIPEDPTSFWSAWTTLESWGACANASGFGVGVYTPGRARFIGGLFGNPNGGSGSNNTCYLSPLEVAPLDKTSTYEYDYWLTVGTIDQIRQEVYELHQSIPPPPTGFPAGDSQVWNFDADGDFGGWTPILNIASSSVSGGAFNATSTSSDPYMYSARIEKPAADNKVVVRLRNGTPSATAQLFFTTAADSAWSESKSKRITTLPNSDFTTYTFDMSTVPGWIGTITDLRLDPAEATGTFAIDWIRIGNLTLPDAVTGAATSITQSSATVGGTVNPSGEATTYHFEFGTTTAYGSQTADTNAGSGTSDQAAAANLSGLSAGTTYHYRVVATNPSGTTAGDDAEFTTAPPTPAESPPTLPLPTAPIATTQPTGQRAAALKKCKKKLPKGPKRKKCITTAKRLPV